MAFSLHSCDTDLSYSIITEGHTIFCMAFHLNHYIYKYELWCCIMAKLSLVTLLQVWAVLVQSTCNCTSGSENIIQIKCGKMGRLVKKAVYLTNLFLRPLSQHTVEKEKEKRGWDFVEFFKYIFITEKVQEFHDCISVYMHLMHSSALCSNTSNP